jgi:hypothetical protein
MPPKFQSSFIPKGPVVSGAATAPAPRTKQKNFVSFLAGIIFLLSFLAALAAFGYRSYLNYSIKAMAAELETQRALMDQEAVDEIRRLNNRLLASAELIDKHVAMTPLFRFLENSTAKNVSFNEMSYEVERNVLNLTLRGIAVSYSALAFQADIFNKTKEFKNPVFSDLSLDERGNVRFTFRASLDPNFISYKREVERNAASQITVPAGSTATTTSAVATSTPASATTSTATSTPN